MSFAEFYNATAGLGDAYKKGLDQSEAPELLRQLLAGQQPATAANGLAALGRGGQPDPAGGPPTNALGALGQPAQSPLPAFARLQGGQPSAKIGGILDAASQAYGLDPSYLPKLAMVESRGDPNARNRSGAAGLLQFMPKTAQAYGLDNPLDPEASADAGARLTVNNAKVLRGALQREPTNGELYLGHQQGAGGAVALLRNPDDNAVGVLARTVYARSADPVATATKAITANGGTPEMTARQFAGKWTSRFDGADPDAANKPAQGSAPAGFQIPGGGAVGLPGAAAGPTRSLDPELLARALGNSVTNPLATAMLGAQVKSGDDYAFTAVGDQFYRTNKRTGSVELVPGVTKPQTTTVAPGSYLVDQVTGRQIFGAPAKPETVTPGGRLVDPATGREIYGAPEKPVPVAPGSTLYDPGTNRPIFTAPEKSGTPSFVQMNGRLVMADPDTGAVRDVTPKDLPQGYRPATAEEREGFKVKPDVPLFIGPDGKPQTLAGQTINVNAGENAQAQQIGADYGKRFAEMNRAGAAATGQLATIGQMERAMSSPGFYSGTGGPAHLAFNRGLVSLGVKDSKAAAPGELFDALSNKVILDGLGGSLGAGISNGDRDFIQRTAPDLAKTPQGNAQLLAYARALAERQQQTAKFARDYYGKNGNKLDPGFDDALARWAEENPITPGGRRSGPTAPQRQAQPQPQQGAPIQPPAPVPAPPGLSDLEAEARRRGIIR